VAQGNWLAAEHDTTVDQLTQVHIDLWQSTGPTIHDQSRNCLTFPAEAVVVQLLRGTVQQPNWHMAFRLTAASLRSNGSALLVAPRA
jgi:hypothetical protein